MMRDRGHLRETLENKAQELFSLCDPEGKGFATKADLEALRCEVPLPPDQLDLVFDALDANGDGKLTLKEFTDGFGIFLGIDSLPKEVNEVEQLIDNEDDGEMLEELLDHLGARNLFTDEDYLREMWNRVRKDDPIMRSNFENLISKMAADLKDSVRERSSLQATLKNRKQDHETQVQTLYMEMEEQLRLEKEKILAQEQLKEQRLRDELETELQLKDYQLSELLAKHAQMESQLNELNSMEFEKKYENVKLQKDRDELENRLTASEKMLHDMKQSLELLRKRSIEEKRKRAQAALKVSEGIALERENLVLELHHLKEINKQLLDEKDELAQSNIQIVPSVLNSASTNSQVDEESSKSKPSAKYLHLKSSSATQAEIKDILEESEKVISKKRSRSETQSHPLMGNDRQYDEKNTSSNIASSQNVPNNVIINAYVEDIGYDLQNNLNIPEGKKCDLKYGRSTNATRCKTAIAPPAPNSPRTSPPVLKKITSKKLTQDESVPTRVFKVVFVGDSGVGKTSILQRFCTNNFKSTYSATVGVDFQIKSIDLDGEKIALQLWDTAGQERFRSMTQQYFRKSDGIIIVYDVTSETSFKNVRSWIHNIQEGAEENTMILLLGNKIDLCEKESDRAVRTKDGARISDEYGTLFYEISAKTGDSVNESLEVLASILKTKEDEAIEQVLKLQEEDKKKKKKCC